MKFDKTDATMDSKNGFERPVKIYSCLGDDEIVISGFAIRCPESDNMEELKENLLNGTDMVTDDSRKFPKGLHPIPSGMGKMKDLSKMDASFFNMPGKFVRAADPQIRILLELAYEAIVDAGYNPQSLRGSRTCVYVGNTIIDNQESNVIELYDAGYSLLGTVRTMLSSRIAHYFDFIGPSYSIDAFCSTSMTCLDNAVHYIRNGVADYAVVASAHMISRPKGTLDLLKLGVLSPDSRSKVFDASANGLVRSEAIAVMFIQKASTAKRNYCSILHIKSSSDGYKEDGFTSSNPERRKILIEESYKEAQINPKDVFYLEANADGTPKDVEEMNIVTDIFCKNRKGPLLVGSVKSNMGHCEPTSGLCQLAKIIIASETGILPANLHYTTPHPKIPGLIKGSLKVVSEPTPWKGGIVGVNTFSYGGTNYHTILKTHNKDKVKHEDKIQKLVGISSRSQEGVEVMLNTMENNPDPELLGLLGELMDNPSSLHYYRGYTILNKEPPVREIKQVFAEQRPLWYVFSGMGCQWIGMGRDMMQIDVFRESMLRSHDYLKPMGIELMDLIMTATEEEFESTIINAFITIGAIQIALVDCLKALGLEPDGMLGHSLGELGCAYADGGFTAEETLMASYWRGHCVFYGDLPPGAMAAVGMGAEEILEHCPPGVVAACHNSKESVTISGPPDAVHELMEKLKAKNIFVRAVKSTGKAFHCYMVNKIAPELLKNLEELIPDPKPRTSRWISTSVLKEDWDSPVAQMCSGQYFANNLVNHVYFSEGMEFVPKNAIVIEIGPHCLLQSIVRQMLTPEAVYLGLAKRNDPDNLQFFLEAMGKLYVTGYNFKITGLLPKVEFPVSRGTQMISPLVRWDHSTNWPVGTFDTFKEDDPLFALSRLITIKPEIDNEYTCLLDYVIDGRPILPVAKYLDIVWKTIAKSKLKLQNQTSAHFENLHVHNHTPIQGPVNLQIIILKGTGKFEVLLGGEIILDGNVFLASDKAPIDLTYVPEPETIETDSDLKTNIIYNTLKLQGYEYGSTFQGILNVNEPNGDTFSGNLKWDQMWTVFLDSVFQFVMLKNGTTDLRLIEEIEVLRIAPTSLMVKGAPAPTDTTSIDTSNETTEPSEPLEPPEPATTIPIWGSILLNTFVAGDVQIKGLKTKAVPRNYFQHLRPVLEERLFVPFDENRCFADSPEIESELQSYNAACCNVIKQGCQKLVNAKVLVLPETQILSSLVKSDVSNTSLSKKALFQDNSAFNSNLIKTLESIFNNPMDASFKSNISVILQNSSLMSDNLMSSLLHYKGLKSCLNIVTENLTEETMTVVETNASTNLLMKSFLNVYTNPKVKMNYILSNAMKDIVSSMSTKHFDVTCDVWDVKQEPFKSEKVELIVAKHTLIHHHDCLVAVVQHIAQSLKDGGFALFYEMIPDTIISKFISYLYNFKSSAGEKTLQDAITKAKLTIIAEKSDGILNKLYLVRKVVTTSSPIQLPVLASATEKWLSYLKKYVKDKNSKSNVWLISEKEPVNGVIGLMKCLKQEEHKNVRCIIYNDLKTSKPAYDAIMKKDLTVNVYKNNKWGSFEYLCTKNLGNSECKQKMKHAHLIVKRTGDLSSVEWVPSPYQILNEPGKMHLCDVYYTAIQKHEVDVALGKLSRNMSKKNDFFPGIEFSGRNANGKRVMGCVSHMGLATTVKPDPILTWDVPNHWTLEQAVTVPVAYSLAYFALCIRGELKALDSVLIHCGCGSVGLAAIAIALNIGATVYTTVGSDEKRSFLKKKFPKLTDDNITDSRSMTFELHILKITKGNGVSVILSSLDDKKIQSAFRCLAVNGRFVQIGRYNTSNAKRLGLKLFLKNLCFMGAYLDHEIGEKNSTTLKLRELVENGIKAGVVQPLPTRVFSLEDQCSAFQLVSTGEHIGKVILKIRDEEKAPSNQTSEISVNIFPSIQCYPQKSYIIAGHVGEFAIALAHWLIEKGAHHLMLNSGVKLQGYQYFQIKQWVKNGVDVQISTENICTLEGAQTLLKETVAKQGSVAGIFVTNASTKDSPIESQTDDNFKNTVKTKVGAIQELEKASRSFCPELNWFVVFSSLVSRYGCDRQTPHGYAHSIIEQIIEKRQSDGLPALNFQLCTSLDVETFAPFSDGKVHYFNGAETQSVVSCLKTLEQLLLFSSSPVVSAVVLPQSKISSEINDQLMMKLLKIIYGEKAEESSEAPLAEAGIDEVTASGIKQILLDYYNQKYSTMEILKMSKQKLLEIINNNNQITKRS